MKWFSKIRKRLFGCRKNKDCVLIADIHAIESDELDCICEVTMIDAHEAQTKAAEAAEQAEHAAAAADTTDSQIIVFRDPIEEALDAVEQEAQHVEQIPAASETAEPGGKADAHEAGGPAVIDEVPLPQESIEPAQAAAPETDAEVQGGEVGGEAQDAAESVIAAVEPVPQGADDDINKTECPSEAAPDEADKDACEDALPVAGAVAETEENNEACQTQDDTTSQPITVEGVESESDTAQTSESADEQIPETPVQGEPAEAVTPEMPAQNEQSEAVCLTQADIVPQLATAECFESGDETAQTPERTDEQIPETPVKVEPAEATIPEPPTESEPAEKNESSQQSGRLQMLDAGGPQTRPSSLAQIEGMTEDYITRLRTSGVPSLRSLYRACVSKANRAKIVQATGISEKLILKWINLADLTRIRGITLEYAQLLHSLGIGTIQELSKVAPEILYYYLERNYKVKNIAKLPPRLQIYSWVLQARQLRRVIQY